MLLEKRVLNQVTILPELNCVNVQWANQIFRDEELISSVYERKAYTQQQKDSFISDVENSDKYLTILGW